jgi:hypothetical protein
MTLEVCRRSSVIVMMWGVSICPPGASGDDRLLRPRTRRRRHEGRGYVGALWSDVTGVAADGVTRDITDGDSNDIIRDATNGDTHDVTGGADAMRTPRCGGVAVGVPCLRPVGCANGAGARKESPPRSAI